MNFRLVHAEALSELMLELPVLANKYDSKSPEFVGKALQWLESLEQLFTANRMYEAGSVALLRAKITSVEQGQISIRAEFRSKPTRSQLLSAAALEALNDAARIAESLIEENKSRLLDAGKVARQVISAAAAMGLLFPRNPTVSSNAYLQEIRRSLQSNSDLSNALVHLDGLVGQNDSLILLDRALAYVDCNPAGHEVLYPEEELA